MTAALILNCPMIIFTDSFSRYHLFNNNTPSAEFCRHNFFQFQHSIEFFTSTEAEPDSTFRLKAADILSPAPGPEEA